MTIMHLLSDVREPDYWLTDEPSKHSRQVDLSDEFIERYEDAGREYDGIQAELELIYKMKEAN